MRKAVIVVFILFIFIPGILTFLELALVSYSFGLLLPVALAGAYAAGLMIRWMRK